MVTPRRIVVGAHYGMGSWLAQRITAVIMALYSVILLAVFMDRRPTDYGQWKALFSNGWMRMATLLFAASLAWHAWVGVRDIVMDYVKPDGLRLAMEVLTILALAGYVVWAAQILWR
jgi:succinate dehydrogenase / fumarate reductase, membrane anchor subunit